MSRSGYTDDGSDQQMLLWERAVQNAIEGKRGQRFLREMLTALDAMPVRELYTCGPGESDDEEPLPPHACCAMGAVALARGADHQYWWAADPGEYAAHLGFAVCLATHIAWLNDESGPLDETPERRWVRMRAWVVANLKVEA